MNEHANTIFHDLLSRCETTSLLAEMETMNFQRIGNSFTGSREMWEELRARMTEKPQ